MARQLRRWGEQWQRTRTIDVEALDPAQIEAILDWELASLGSSH
jgi:hypothetical protein